MWQHAHFLCARDHVQPPLAGDLTCRSQALFPTFQCCTQKVCIGKRKPGRNSVSRCCRLVCGTTNHKVPHIHLFFFYFLLCNTLVVHGWQQRRMKTPRERLAVHLALYNYKLCCCNYECTENGTPWLPRLVFLLSKIANGLFVCYSCRSAKINRSCDLGLRVEFK